MEEIIKIAIIAVVVNILLFVIGQNYIFGILDEDIQKYRKEDNNKLHNILSQYQQYLEENQKNNFEFQKGERKRTEKYVKDEIKKNENTNKSDLNTLCSRIPDEIRHNPKILLNKDIYNHISNIVNMASKNLPKLEDKGFIKDSNIDDILDDIQYSGIFKQNELENKVIVKEPVQKNNNNLNNNNLNNNNNNNNLNNNLNNNYNNNNLNNNYNNNNLNNNNYNNNSSQYYNYDTSSHSHSQNTPSMIPLPVARDIESYKFINNENNPFNYLGGKSV
jgi:hypothetical protein